MTRELSVPLRVAVVNPPEGVTFRLQDGTMLIEPDLQAADKIVFDFAVRLKDDNRTRSPRFLGRFVNGSTEDRFIYVCSGTLAGQADSCWTRRAKIKLADISWSLIDEASAEYGKRIMTSFQGKARDGGPSCATVPLDQWRVVSQK